jgi:heme A synthase
MNQESKNDSNIKDKISIASLIVGIILGGLAVIFYLTEDHATAQVLLYPLGGCFLVWLATRINGCGSCNQVSN